MEDQPADSGDLTTGAAEADEATEVVDTPTPDEPTRPRHRWRHLWRRSSSREGAPDEAPAAVDESADATADVAETEDVSPAPRTPVGKARRATKAEREPDEVIADEPADETVEAEPAGDETSEAEPAADVTESAESAESAAEEAILVPHQPAGRRMKIAAVAAAALFVAAAAFAGAVLQPFLADRALVHNKLDVARTAANAITTLWTYTPENMDTLPDRSASYLGGDFAADYRKYIDAIVAPNKQAQVTNSTQVLGTAVETLTPSEATAIVYTNSVATSPVTKNIPSLRYLSYRLILERRDAKWLITRMTTVTSLDLTPQL